MFKLASATCLDLNDLICKRQRTFFILTTFSLASFIFSCLSFNDVPSYRDCFLLNLASPNADYAIGVKQADDKSVYSV